MDKNQDSKWSRTLSPMEKMMFECHKRRFMLIRYDMRLCSKHPLEEEKVQLSLAHLQRKIPTLRLCIREREEKKLWFRARDNEEIDFQFGEAGVYEKERTDFLNRIFNTSEGPLWRARIFPCMPNTPFHIEHLRGDFPFQYNFLFGFHHSITDGMSNMRICDAFLKILNDVMSGKAPHDDEQLGHHVTTRELEENLEEIKSTLLKNETETQNLNKLIDDVDNVKLLIHKGYPSETPDRHATQEVTFDLSEEETKKLTAKCKSEGITINSALCTAVHAATANILKKANMISDSYTIYHVQLVSLRRYWSSIESFPLGECVGSLQMVSKVPSDIEDKFWELAKEFNGEVKHLLKNKVPIKVALLRDMGGIKKVDIENVLLSNDPRMVLNATYVMSNCGDLRDIFNGEGEYVQATHLSRGTSFRHYVSEHAVHSFRGKLLYSLHYDEEFLSGKGAKQWCDGISKILKQVL